MTIEGMHTETPRNEIQFRLRTLLIGMAVVAVVLAFATLWLQVASPRIRWFIARWVVIYFVLGLGWYMFVGHRRGRASREAGRRLLSTNPLSRFAVGMMALAMISIFAMLPVIFGLSFLRLSGPPPAAGMTGFEWTSELNLFAMTLNTFSLFSVAIFGGMGMYKKHLCENGVLQGLAFYPWEKFHRWNWKSHDPNVAILWGLGTPYEFKVTTENRQQVEELLDRFIPAAHEKAAKREAAVS